jgi:beta-glucanase (GH16 family)
VPPSEPNPGTTLLPDLVQNQQANWSVIFSDDFNNGHLNLNKWVTCYWWDRKGCTNSGNNELEWYLPENVQFDGQSVKLVAEPQSVHASDGHTYAYSSGMITTGRNTQNTSQPVKFAFKYGFAEIRAKAPSGQGIWPAFWMLPASNADLPEIDAMEIIGNDPYTVNMSLHFAQTSGSVVKDGDIWKGSQDLSLDWHTYAVDWEPTFIAWYVDGVERGRYTDQKNIPSEPMYLLLNLAIGGDWPGAPDDTTSFPSVFQIDSIRVWQHPSP